MWQMYLSRSDLEDFIDKKHMLTDGEIDSTNIVVLTEHENALVNRLWAQLTMVNTETLGSMQQRLIDMRQLATSITHFPSLLQTKHVLGEYRSEETLIESLLRSFDGDKTLHLPSKATLGKGFLVAKYHMFDSFARIAQEADMDDDDIQEFKTITSTLLFTLMAEDVYLSLLDDLMIPPETRRLIARALITLWEHRTDTIVRDIAPVLQSVWDAQKKLAPVFGTMMGTSELIRISIDLDDNWNRFIRAKLSNRLVANALEEFLFGMSYEQIGRLKKILRKKKISSIGRDEISEFLHEKIMVAYDLNLNDFYMMYTIRRDNARARKRLHLDGPHNTLEDHYMAFILDQTLYAKATVSPPRAPNSAPATGNP